MTCPTKPIKLPPNCHRRMAKPTLQFISVSKCKYSKKLLSMTLDTVKYGAGDGGKDEVKVLLPTAAEEGNTHVTVCRAGFC